jgi:hypothetical protein
MRFPTDVPVMLHDDGGATTRAERTSDLGFRGVCVAAREPVEVGSSIEVEIEVLMPTRISLGYDINALTIEGPPVSHLARMEGCVRRCEPAPTPGLFHIGIEFLAPRDEDGERIVELYLEQLEEHDNDQDWIFEA